jgi:hypothetical protein
MVAVLTRVLCGRVALSFGNVCTSEEHETLTSILHVLDEEEGHGYEL